MNLNINALFLTDSYKLGHKSMYSDNTTLVYSNLTPRGGKYTNIDGTMGVIAFGQQMVIKQIVESFDKTFFRRKEIIELVNKQYELDPDQLYEDIDFEITERVKNETIQHIKDEISLHLGTEYDVKHIEELWDIGYLPINVKTVKEGSFVPYGVPVLTIYNTLPSAYWLVNYLETILCNSLWLPMTNATSSFEYKKLLNSWAVETDVNNVNIVNFQGHNFSFRSMPSFDSALSTGLAHSISFLGDDNLPTIQGVRHYYNENNKDFIVGSVLATEHSVQSSLIMKYANMIDEGRYIFDNEIKGCTFNINDYGDENTSSLERGELLALLELLTKFPKGILSVVSDTFNLWHVIKRGGILEFLKDEILGRDGKLVIRPDSGNPIDILCGLPNYTVEDNNVYETYHCTLDNIEKKRVTTFVGVEESKGLIKCLYDIFGGTINDQNYIKLHDKIGAIYGDGINYDKIIKISKGLKANKFASTNVVYGIGGYTYDFSVSRDTHAFAFKSTYTELENGNRAINLLKDPITGSGKKSAQGLLRVEEENGTLVLHEKQTWEQESKGVLKSIFCDGVLTNEETFSEIRERLNKLL